MLISPLPSAQILQVARQRTHLPSDCYFPKFKMAPQGFGAIKALALLDTLQQF
jgi:hypothetical protein